MMRNDVMLAAFGMVIMLSANWVQAQPSTPDVYPTKPVRVVVGLAPGGATDVQARIFSQKLSEELGRQFIVDNRAGAGGLIGFQTVANATPDGYTLLAATPGFTIAPAFYDRPPYDPIKDFSAVSLVTKAPFLVVVHPSFPAKSMNELIAFAKSKPGALNFGVGGLGTSIHLGAVWISSASNVKITLIPYKGTGPVLSELLAGQIHVTLANPINVIPHVKAGRLRALATTGAERFSVLPGLPTVAESGIAGFDVTTWHGWLAPRNTPAAIVDRLSAALAKFVKAPDTMEKLAADGGEAVGNTPAQFSQFIAAETQRWRSMVKATGIRAE
jgi:tripartite-type tricarboxylate transporter receptor subunit TctC